MTAEQLEELLGKVTQGEWVSGEHRHWRVTVETGSEQIVCIETECLSGRELSRADEATIRQAARHLLSFIGDPPPAGAQFLANEDGEFNGNEWEGPLSGEEQAMIDAAWEKHKSALTESPYLACRVLAAEKLVEAAQGMKRIVEEIDGAMKHGTWRDENGLRLKDTSEWVAFYNALTAYRNITH